MSGAAGAVRGVTLVASTYVYFLLFAQFGLVRLLRERLDPPGSSGAVTDVELAMAAMGVAGLVTSLVVGRLLRRDGRSGALLVGGFLVCASSAALAPAAATRIALLAVSVAVGTGLALVTVTLAATLRGRLHPRRMGLQVGLGTGLAYALCNLPALFEGPPAAQAGVAAAAAAVGAGTALLSGPPPAPVAARTSTDGDGAFLGVAALVASFLALVWLDSAAFNVIQETTGLRQLTWETTSHKVAMAVAHLLGAILAGALLDRGVMRSLLFGAWALFLASFTVLQSAEPVPGWVGPVYAVGISVYSTALVFFPTGLSVGPGLVAPRWRAAWAYGIGGWLGSALGVGMAQDLQRIPGWFLGASGALLAGSWLLGAGRRLARPARLGSLGASTLVGLVLLVAGRVGTAPRLEPGRSGAEGVSAGFATVERDLVERGRRVYVQEGCINCHSQFLRPRVDHDDEWWGPVRPLDRDQAPPLVGNRRQGPDLLQVGNRRSEAWQRQHLRAPRSVSPGSRMPSYAHLFRGADGEPSRGDALVAYLGSLGSDTANQRLVAIESHSVRGVGDGDRERGRALFSRYCTGCHGARGWGDGPVSDAVSGRAVNLGKDSFWLPTWDGTEGSLEQGLARVVRHGVAGTDMPGHEWLSDREVADLVAYVVGLPGTGPEAEPADSFYEPVDAAPAVAAPGAAE